MLSIINRKLVFPFIELLRREPISRCLSELNKTQWYSFDQLRELQWKKLSILMHHCYKNVPFYKEIFNKLKLKPEDIQSFQDFKLLPFLTKEHLRSHKSELMDKSSKYKIEHCHSGGTLGRPLNFMRDSMSSAYIRAAQFRGFSWHGIKKGDRQIRIWGLPFDKKLAKKDIRKDFLVNRIRIPPFDIRKENVLHYFKIMKKFKPKYIYGYPSAIFKMSQLMNDEKLNGEELFIKYVVTTAETLYDHQRRLIESFLNCKVLNEYGCSEMGPIAFECEKGHFHINMENVLVEFIEDDGFTKENAEIILTNLNNLAMPFLRYKIEDTGQLLKLQCDCGRKLESMSFNAGRVLGTLVATDGHFVSGTVFCYIAFDLIEKYKGIKDFRVTQKHKNKIEITLSKEENFNNHILNLFSSKVKELLGSNITINYIFKDEIPLEKSGKRLFVHSELENRF